MLKQKNVVTEGRAHGPGTDGQHGVHQIMPVPTMKCKRTAEIVYEKEIKQLEEEKEIIAQGDQKVHVFEGLEQLKGKTMTQLKAVIMNLS